MRIVHICPIFTDGFSYQENYLVKFHRRLGMNVSVISSTWVYNTNGQLCQTSMGQYVNRDGVRVIRLQLAKNKRYTHKFKRFEGFVKVLDEESPDILFVHGCQFLDIDIVVHYLKSHKNVIVYVDNHADFSNSATNWLSLNILHKIIWKHCAHQILPYTKKFYGVLPARVDFLKNVYGIPADKVELLIMGADDDKVAEALEPSLRISLRQKYGIADDDFLIVTGGKIDKAKQQTLLLMEAVQQLSQNDAKIKLLVFGSVIPEMKDAVAAKQSKNVQYIGWVNSEDTYKYFGMADLACFPGRHSVFWEQVAGMGIPMLVKYWDGTTHVDMDGNVVFLHEDSAEEIEEKITQIRESYAVMKEVAEVCAPNFLYSKIAEKSLQ